MNNFDEVTENASNGKRKRKFLKRKLTDTLPVMYLLMVVLIVPGQFLGAFLEFIPFLTSTDVGFGIEGTLLADVFGCTGNHGCYEEPGTGT